LELLPEIHCLGRADGCPSGERFCGRTERAWLRLLRTSDIWWVHRAHSRGSVDGGRGVVTRLPAPLSGVDRSYEWRVSFPVSERSKAGVRYFRVYEDYLGFFSGPADVALVIQAYGQPVATTVTERRLLSLLYSRAKS
jgi:hypothetical protein